MAKNPLRRRNKCAQGMTEYIIIVGLIAIAVITCVQTFGKTVDDGFKKSNEKLTGVVTGF